MSEGKLGSCGDAGWRGSSVNMSVGLDWVIVTPGYCWFLLHLLYVN